MPIFNLSVALPSSYPIPGLNEKMGLPGADGQLVANNLIKLLSGLACGAITGKVALSTSPSVDTSRGSVALDIAFANVIPGTSRFSIGSPGFTPVSSSPNYNDGQFLAGANAAACAANLVALVNVNSGFLQSALSASVTASNVALDTATVTFKSSQLGLCILGLVNDSGGAFVFDGGWSTNATAPDLVAAQYLVQGRYGF